MKDNAQESIVNYDGNARPGEMVVNLLNNDIYIGNTDGNLSLISTGGGGAHADPSGPVSAIQINAGGNLFTGSANLTFLNNIVSVIGNVNSTNVYASSNIVAAGNVTANYGIFSGGNTVINSTISTTGNIIGGNILTVGVVSASGNITANYFAGNGSQLTGIVTSGITTVLPAALSSTVHIAATTVGNTANIITDATTANTANTIVVRDANGAINVNGWTVGTHLTAVNYTATNSDYWIGTTAKSITITLPNAANGASTGRQYQIADTVHSGNPGTTIAAQSPATVVGNQPSQQGQIIIATYVGTTWYLN